MAETSMYVVPGPDSQKRSQDTVVDTVIKRYEKAKSEHELWHGLWQDVYDYMIPGRVGFKEHIPGQSNTDFIYNDAGVIGLQEFASEMQEGVMPTYQPFFALEPIQEIEGSEGQRIQGALDAITEDVLADMADSPMVDQTAEQMMDIGLGTGAQVIQPGPNITEPILFQAVPLTQFCCDRGPNNRIDGKFWRRKMPADEILVEYPGAEIPKEVHEAVKADSKREFEIIECITRDWTYMGERWLYRVICKTPKSLILDRAFTGVGSDPWIVARWMVSAGETYGRGPALNVIQAVKTLNLVEEMLLESAQMSITGMWQTDTINAINVDTIRLVPGAVLPKSVGSNGLEAVEPPGRIDLSQFIIENLEASIKRGLYNQDLGPTHTTPMTATEVNERMAQLWRRIGAPVGRLWNELVIPIVRRVIYLKQQAGEIELPSTGRRGPIKIKPRGPFATAQNYDRANQRTRYVMTIREAYGPEMQTLLLKQREGSLDLAHLLDYPKDLIRTEEEVQEETQKLMDAVATQGIAGGQGPVQQ